MYKLKEELALLFDILWAMDRNDSLKQIAQRSPIVSEDADIHGPSCEKTNTRQVSGDMYISRDDVNRWAREAVAQAAASEGVSSSFKFHFCIANITVRTLTTMRAPHDGRTWLKS
jgi:hypothetical protein